MTSLRSLILVAALLFTTACSSEDATPAESTPAPVSTLAATATPLAPVAPIRTERVPFTWTPSDQILDLASAVESDDPLAAAWDELAALSAQTGQPSVDSSRDWRLSIMFLREGPQLIYETPRRIDALRWEQSGISADFMTYRQIDSALLQKTLSLQWFGSMSLDPTTGSAIENLEGYPALPAQSGHTSPDVMFVHAPTGQVILNRPAPGSTQRPYDIYVQNAAGEARKLDLQVGASDMAHFSPDGSAVVFTGDHTVFRYNQAAGGGPLVIGYDTFFMPIDGTEALKVSGAAHHAEKTDLDGSPDSSETRIALLVAVNDASGPTFRLATYDSRTQQLRTVATLPISNTATLQWLAGTDIVIVGNDAVDLNTGAITRSSAIQAPTFVNTSPDGRLAVRTPERDTGQVPPADVDCAGQPYRVELEDLQSQTTSVLLDCASGFLSRAQWLDNEHIVVFVSTRLSAGGSNGLSTVLRLNVRTRLVVPLVSEYDLYSQASPSPDGNLLVLTGPTMRLFDMTGALLRDFGPPPAGYKYGSIAWPPCSRCTSFAFVLSPAAADYRGP